jgi:hypothetical protein
MKLSHFNDVTDVSARIVDVNWPILSARLTRHDIGPKAGPGVCFATFDTTRGREGLKTRTAIALDIETSRTTGEVPPSVETAFRRLQALGHAGLVATTWSHREDAPRYRIVVPVPEIDLGDDTMALIDPWLPIALARRLGLEGVIDASKLGADSYFFLPRHPAGRANQRFAAVAEGPVIDLMGLCQDAIALQVTEEREQRARLRQSMTMDPKIRQVIESFNARHPVEVLLARYGYHRRGRRWRSPFQSRLSAGATEVKHEPDGTTRWISFSESDRLAKVGMIPQRGSQCMTFGNSFDLMRKFEANNDFGRALEIARKGE